MEGLWLNVKQHRRACGCSLDLDEKSDFWVCSRSPKRERGTRYATEPMIVQIGQNKWTSLAQHGQYCGCLGREPAANADYTCFESLDRSRWGWRGGILWNGPFLRTGGSVEAM